MSPFHPNDLVNTLKTKHYRDVKMPIKPHITNSFLTKSFNFGIAVSEENSFEISYFKITKLNRWAQC